MTTSTELDTCAHCGAGTTRPVTGAVRASIVVYCSAGCRDDHLAALALAGSTCIAPGCDLDAAADVPFCDEHLDPAAPSPRRRTRAA
jgi:hypothetical protein